jgi:hypothetical protein
MPNRSTIFAGIFLAFAMGCDAAPQQASPQVTLPSPSPAPPPQAVPKKQIKNPKTPKARIDRVNDRPTSTTAPKSDGHHWGDPYDWIHAPPKVKRIDVSKYQFETMALHETLQRWEIAAQNINQISNARGDLQTNIWHHESWYREPRKNVGAMEWWSNRPELIAPDGSIEGGTEYEARNGDIHVVTIRVFASTAEERVRGLTLQSRWQPKSGCGATLDCTTYDGETASILLRFSNYGFFPLRWQHLAEFENVHYEFKVALSEASADHLASNPISFEKLCQWSSSPEVFREAGLEMLDRLEKSIAAEIESGTAIKRVYTTQTIGGTHGGDPPQDLAIDSDRPLSAWEKQAVSKLALAEIAPHRKVFEKDYAAMHTALVKVFPLNTLGKPSEKQ